MLQAHLRMCKEIFVCFEIFWDLEFFGNFEVILSSSFRNQQQRYNDKLIRDYTSFSHYKRKVKLKWFYSGMKIEINLSNKFLPICFLWKKLSLHVDLNVLSAFLFGQPNAAAVNVLLSFQKHGGFILHPRLNFFYLWNEVN